MERVKKCEGSGHEGSGKSKHGCQKSAKMSFGNDVEGLSYLCFFDNGSWFQVKFLFIHILFLQNGHKRQQQWGLIYELNMHQMF